MTDWLPFVLVCVFIGLPAFVLASRDILRGSK